MEQQEARLDRKITSLDSRLDRNLSMLSDAKQVIWMADYDSYEYKQDQLVMLVDQVEAKAREANLMPEEVFSERNKMADDGTLAKVLTYDIIRQTRRSAGLASVDADNCYDRIAHEIASLVF